MRDPLTPMSRYVLCASLLGPVEDARGRDDVPGGNLPKLQVVQQVPREHEPGELERARVAASPPRRRVHVRADLRQRRRVQRGEGRALGQYLPQLHVVLLAGPLLVRPGGVRKVARAPLPGGIGRGPLRAVYVVELAPAIEDHQAEQLGEAATALLVSAALLEPVERPDDAVLGLGRQPEVDLEVEVDAVERQDARPVPLPPEHRVDLGRAGPLVCGELQEVVVLAAGVEPGVVAGRLPPAFLVLDLLGELDGEYRHRLVLHVSVEAALRARELVGLEDVVHRLPLAEPVAHGVDQQPHFGLREVDAVPGLSRAPPARGVGALGAVLEAGERARRVPLAAVAGEGRPLHPLARPLPVLRAAHGLAGAVAAAAEPPVASVAAKALDLAGLQERAVVLVPVARVGGAVAAPVPQDLAAHGGDVEVDLPADSGERPPLVQAVLDAYSLLDPQVLVVVLSHGATSFSSVEGKGAGEGYCDKSSARKIKL